MNPLPAVYTGCPSLIGWGYNEAVIINNTGNINSLSNYQVMVTVNTYSLISEGHMNSDGSDIRFTDNDGCTPLNFWIESGINTPNTIIWGKIPTIPVASIYTIYMYYGNPGSISMSNGNSTFFFFDDFNGTYLDLTKWTATSYNGTGSSISQQ